MIFMINRLELCELDKHDRPSQTDPPLGVKPYDRRNLFASTCRRPLNTMNSQVESKERCIGGSVYMPPVIV